MGCGGSLMSHNAGSATTQSIAFITINVPLFKKLRDIIFFCGTITLCARDNLRGQKSLGPSKCPSKWLIKLLSHKKNYVLKFLKQRDIGNFMYPSAVVYCC